MGRGVQSWLKKGTALALVLQLVLIQLATVSSGLHETLHGGCDSCAAHSPGQGEKPAQGDAHPGHICAVILLQQGIVGTQAEALPEFSSALLQRLSSVDSIARGESAHLVKRARGPPVS